jgi:periplasmic protein TonB
MKIFFIFLLVFICTSVCAQPSDTTGKPEPADSNIIFTKVEVEASFPGGEMEWNKYINKQIEKNIPSLVDDWRSRGICIVQFIVDKDGSISEVKALTLQKSFLAKLTIAAIKNGPKWNPASQNGRTVKSYRRQKVTFKVD